MTESVKSAATEAERLTEERLAELERLEREAREWCGPTWEVKAPPDPDGRDEPWLATPTREDGSASIVATGMASEDARLAAAARNALPALLRAARRSLAAEEVVRAARALVASEYLWHHRSALESALSRLDENETKGTHR